MKSLPSFPDRANDVADSSTPFDNDRLTQAQNRYKPAPKMLGWHIAFWNLIGGLGFTICPALGFGSQDSAALEYASGLSTFIGSWAFLVRF